MEGSAQAIKRATLVRGVSRRQRWGVLFLVGLLPAESQRRLIFTVDYRGS
jgi:hypothetical protein